MSITTAPNWFVDASGAWHEIDLSAVGDGAGGFVPASHPLPLRVSGTASGTVADLPTSAGTIGISYVGLTGAAGSAENRTVTYADGLSDARSLSISFRVDGFEDMVILPTSAAAPSYTNLVTVPDGVVAEQADGRVDFRDLFGSVVASLGGGIAYDSHSAVDAGAAETPVQVALVGQGAGVATVAVSISGEWLLDADRVFPVVIDPTWTASPPGYNACPSGTPTAYDMCDLYVNSDAPALGYPADGQLRVGFPNTGSTETATGANCNPGSPNRTRSYIKHETDNYGSTGYTVTAATLRVTRYGGSTGSGLTRLYGLGSSFNRNTTWNSQPGGCVQSGGSDGYGIQDTITASTNGTYYFDIAALAQRWFNGQTNWGVKLVASLETSTSGFRQFYPGESGSGPRLDITYVLPPTAPSAPTSVNAVAGDGTVTASWAAPYNGGSAITMYEAYLYDGGVYTGTWVQTCASCLNAVFNGLTNGRSYRVDVYARNSVGLSPAASSNTVVPYGAPTPPRSPAAAAGNASATVTWLAPSSNNGAAVTSYQINSYNATTGGYLSTKTVCGTCLNTAFTGLTVGAPYYFIIWAYNGAYSQGAQTNTITPAGPPSPVQNVGGRAHNTAVSLRWDPPAATNGAAIDFTYIEAYDTISGYAGATTACATCTSALVNGLTNGRSYYFVLFAHNPHGYSSGIVTNTVKPGFDEAVVYGLRSSAGYAEDPVNTAIGNFVHQETDLTFPVFGLDLARTYNSKDTAAGRSYGLGWASMADVKLAEVTPGGDVALTEADGRRVVFTNAGWSYLRPGELWADLVKNPDGSFRITYQDGHRDEFDSTGRRTSSVNWDGQTVTYAYNGTDLISASSSTGYSITLTRVGSRVTRATASDGRSVDYLYVNNTLESSTNPDGDTTFYQRDVAGRITLIDDASATVLISNTYDAQGRIASQATPTNSATFAYDTSARRVTVHNTDTNTDVIFAYDLEARTSSITDPYGKALEKTYDIDGNLTAAVDRRGAEGVGTYDSRGNLLAHVGPDGVTTTYTYDSADRVTTITNGAGETTAYAYDGNERIPSTVTEPAATITTYDVVGGLVQSVTDADGVTTTYTYDTQRNLTAATNEAAKTWSYEYDTAGRVTAEETPLGRRTTHTYDNTGRKLSTTDPTGTTTSHTYDGAGRVATSTDAIGEITTYTYDSAGRRQTVTDPLGNVTTNGYDANGNLNSVTRPGAATWTADYDSLGRRLSETDPTGVVTTYGYDDDGNLTTTTAEDGGITTDVYDLRGRLESSTDPLNRTTSYEYDTADRLVAEVDPANGRTTYAYDDLGRVVIRTDPRGGQWTTSYTPAGRVAIETDPNNHATTNAYDTLGRLSSVADALGHATTYGYDIDDRTTSETSATGLVRQFTYDGADRVLTTREPWNGLTTTTYTPRGQVASVIDPTGGVQTFAYDDAGRMIEAVDALNRATDYTYDGRGNQLTVTDANGGVWATAYDLADRVVSETDPLNRVTTRTYDNTGRLSIIADASGRTATHAYNLAGELTSRAFTTGPAITYTYDPLGRRSTMTDSSGTTSSTWDAAGNLTQQSAGGRVLRWGYDLARNRTTMTYPGGSQASFGYDAADRLTTVAHPAGASSYTYDNDNRPLTETLPAGVARSYAYTSGLLTSYRETRGGAAVHDTQRTYDLAGRVATETKSGRANIYQYDPAGQLTRVQGGLTDAVAYSYDDVGNRTTRASSDVIDRYTYDAADQLSSVTRARGTDTLTTATLGHDSAGRLTSASTGTNHRVFTYDSKGDLAATQHQTLLLGSWTTAWAATRTTNGDGHIVRDTRTIAGQASTSAELTWDTSQPLRQLAASSTQPRDYDYLYGLGRIMAIRGSTAPAVFSRDAYGSATASPDTAELATAGSYDAYGVPAATNGSAPLLDHLLGDNKSNTVARPTFGYRGELTLDGLVDLRARQYAPGLGRFLTTDPLDGRPGTPTAANPYPYAANDPINKVDPLGLTATTDRQLSGHASKSPLDMTDPTGLFNEAGCTSGGYSIAGYDDDYERDDPGNYHWCRHSWRHPSRINQCRLARRGSNWAGGKANEYGGSIGQVNARRHCMWAAVMTMDIGENSARGFLSRHEEHTPQDDPDHFADLWNNEIGIRIGRKADSRSTIQFWCGVALWIGQLDQTGG